MRDFPSCFGENGVQVADSSLSSSSSRTTKTAHNLVSCIYQCKLQGRLCLINVTWTKNLMGQGLTIEIDDAANECLCKVDIKPWIFSKRKGYKTLEADSSKIDINWDLTNARFGPGPEPLEKFYLAVMFDQEIVLLLGDLKREYFIKNPAKTKSRSVFVAKREHIFGKKTYGSKAQFCERGQTHEVTIECETVGPRVPYLVISIDGKVVIEVKRLNWKFRGNQSILVDGLKVEVFWDVYNWLFGNSSTNPMGSAVFMFQTCINGVFDKRWTTSPPPAVDPSSGFSLVLHAWKSELK